MHNNVIEKVWVGHSGGGGGGSGGAGGSFTGITSYVLCATRRGVSVNHMRLELQAQQSD